MLGDLFTGNTDEKNATVRRQRNTSASKQSHLEIFEVSGDATSTTEQTAFKSASGSVVIVRKKDLAELQKRMAEMEDALDRLQGQQSAQTIAKEFNSVREDDELVWIPASHDIDSLSGLSSWILMTAMGAGIVAAEVLISKVSDADS